MKILKAIVKHLGIGLAGIAFCFGVTATTSIAWHALEQIMYDAVDKESAIDIAVAIISGYMTIGIVLGVNNLLIKTSNEKFVE